MKPTTYSGYSVWPDGLSLWPRRKLSRRWDDLVSIHSAFGPQGKSLIATMVFRVGAPLTLQAARFFTYGTGPGRFAELIAQAVAAAPPDAAIDDLTFDIAQCGPREVRRRLYARTTDPESVEIWLERARHHRVWLENARARKAVNAALLLGSNHPKALELRYQLTLERGDVKQARKTAEDWRSRCPQEPRAQAAVLLMRLALDDHTAAPEAAQFLENTPGQDELWVGLATHYFRAGEYMKAAERWTRIAETAKDAALRQHARDRQRHAERTARDAAFRWREKLIRWGRLTLAWLLVIMSLTFQGARVYEIFTRKEREQEKQQQTKEFNRQWAEETKQRLAAADRQFIELTGRVMGDYAAVRVRADQGEAAAQLTLAEMLWDGSKGAPKDPAAALAYLEKSVAQGHRAALLSLGQKLVAGRDVPRDAARAARLFEQAVGLDSPRAAAELAELYQKGDGVDMDKARAFALYAKAAESGYVYAESQTGWMLEHGEGVVANRTAALGYYRQAAEKKNDWATERLVRLFGAPTASAEEKTEAWKWLKLGAQRGLASLRLQVAGAVLSGRHEDAELLKEAKAWLEQAVLAKQPGASTQQGLCLLNGWGWEQDLVRANQCFEIEQATDQTARILLARNLAFGVGGPRDLARAWDLLASLNDSAQHRWLEAYVKAAEAIDIEEMTSKPRFQPPPEYPPALSRQGVEGEAVIRFVIDGEGFTRNVEVVSATHPAFGYAARLTVSFWRFTPIANDTSTTRQITIQFNLQNESAQRK